jgi:tRNA(adenine34) deaminase
LSRQVQPTLVHWTEADYSFMELALQLARQSLQEDEVPVGAAVVLDGVVIGTGRNRPISASDPTAHAEVQALRAAAAHARNYRLAGTTLYVTLEPCAMCAGAIVIARVARLVFAARDLRFGAVRSKFRIADSELLNHKVRVDEGLMAVEASELIAGFFAAKRSCAP